MLFRSPAPGPAQAKPSRLHCSHCDETYTLPQNGTIKLYKELRCPLDDFELVLWSSGSRGKSYPLCPYCSNHPPFRDMKKGEPHLPAPPGLQAGGTGGGCWGAPRGQGESPVPTLLRETRPYLQQLPGQPVVPPGPQEVRQKGVDLTGGRLGALLETSVLGGRGARESRKP